MKKHEFYEICSEMFSLEHIPPSVLKKTRWGPREPGPGRLLGYGLVRWYSETSIHVMLKHPIKSTITFNDPKIALDYLDKIRSEIHIDDK